MGCGTGIYLTAPLAEAFPNVGFLGVDNDTRSIDYARGNNRAPNLRFAELSTLGDEAAFDLVIASEVLEHVDDPPPFLDRLVTLARPDGRIVLTVPNGYGPFEQFALIEALLNVSGLQRLLRSLKRLAASAKNRGQAADAVTLSISPHVNFFSQVELLRLFDDSGMTVNRFRSNTFLCGYGVDGLIRSKGAIAWNASFADHLPRWCVSDWMFELAVGSRRRPSTWRRGRWASFRRQLNRRRWGLA